MFANSTLDTLTYRASANGLPEGFTARPTTRDDHRAVTDLINLCAVADTGRPTEADGELLVDWSSPGFDLAANTCVVLAPDGRIVGYGEVWNVQEPRVLSWVWSHTHPDYRAYGIDSYLLRRAEDRARELIPLAPPGTRITLRAGISTTRHDAIARLESAGFENVRTFLKLGIDLDTLPSAPVWPDGIALRTVRGTDDELYRVWAAKEETFQDHWGRLPVQFESWLHWTRHDHDVDLALWFLAMDGDEIAGVCLCRLQTTEFPDTSCVDTLGVRRPWRRRGIALALLRHAFVEFYRRGQRKAALGVDADSLTGATALYEKAGMREFQRHFTFEKELRPGVELSARA